jgi:hypothetical protein
MPFAATVVDKSNTVGFQFEFHCLRCGTAYASNFHALSSLAADAGGTALKKVGGLLGSRAGKVFEAVGDYVGDLAADAIKDQAKDRAFQAAVQEVAPQFILCSGCRRWMCRPVCFNAPAGLCQDCVAQGGTARPPAPQPASDQPPPRNVTPPPQPKYAGYALPSPLPQPSATALPSHPVKPGYAPHSPTLAPGFSPSPPLQVHIRPSRHHPGTVSLVVVDIDDKVIAVTHLEPDDARELANDLLSAAQAAVRRLADRH